MRPDEAAAREAKVLGRPVRIRPLTPDELTGEAAQLSAEISAVLGIGEPDELAEYFAIMARHPSVYRCQMEAGIQLLGHGTIPPVEREMVILRTAWLCGAPYEWTEHIVIARRLGVTPEVTDRVTQGPQADGWTGHERALLRAVDELIDDKMISDATWDALAAVWSPAQMIELPALVGQYMAVALIQNSLRLPMNAGRQGFLAR